MISEVTTTATWICSCFLDVDGQPVGYVLSAIETVLQFRNLR